MDGNTAVFGSMFDINLTGKADIYEKNTTSGQWEHVKSMYPPGFNTMEQYGRSVAVSGDIIVVGASHNDDAGMDEGAAYIYYRDQGGDDNWGLVKTIYHTSPNMVGSSTQFGAAVDISGDDIIVGAYNYSDPFPTFNTGRGSAYIFSQHTGGSDNWGQVAMLLADDGDPFQDFFGGSVSIDGGVAVASSADDESNFQSGAAYVFYEVWGWALAKKLKASDPDESDFLGSCDVSGDLIVLGASGDDEIAGGAGAAYIFGKDVGGSNNWGEVKKITGSDINDIDQFGQAVAIYGTTVVVGAPQQNANTFQLFGAAYVFDQDEGGSDNWGETMKLIPSDVPDGLRFGWDVDVRENSILVGSSENDGVAQWAGAAYHFVPTVDGCTDDVACNYDVLATADNGTCFYVGDPCDDGDSNTVNDTYQDGCVCGGEAIVEGCTDGGACNFDSAANTDDSSCFFTGDSCDDNDEWTENDAYDVNCDCTGDEIPQVLGCMDSAACNFNAQANVDDGSCTYVALYDIIGTLTTDILVEETYIYNSTAGSSYNWTVDGGAIGSGQSTNSVTAIWSATGAYDLTVMETDADGCEGDPVTIIVQVGPINISDLHDGQFEIYPNPAKNQVTLDLGTSSEVFQVQIFNALAQVVYTDQLIGKSTIATRSWESGIYLVVLSNENGRTVRKLVVE